MDREGELNAAVENCRRPCAEQVSLNDSKHAVCQVFISHVTIVVRLKNAFELYQINQASKQPLPLMNFAY
ncbi:hypothetical protein DdX_21147 [Ditylenchus destructor]|uniref:Uncharacterized protein n=1 Tax=Ditylenchus destructor TaxID=166010 RepID=A0AAD4MG13_9BILA|nr:hypothetical protein DdX_21147 [Ditylenchus destructor]